MISIHIYIYIYISRIILTSHKASFATYSTGGDWPQHMTIDDSCHQERLERFQGMNGKLKNHGSLLRSRFVLLFHGFIDDYSLFENLNKTI